MCTPHLQRITPTSNCKHMKTNTFIFQPLVSSLVVQTATGSSDSPAVHVLLVLGLPQHTLMEPSVPEELTQVFPVLMSPPLAELERSIEDIHMWTLISRVLRAKRVTGTGFFPPSF